MHHEDTRARCHALALSARGYRAVNGHGEGGFWVRNADLTKPPFVDEHSFISHAKAKLLFQEKETSEMNDVSESIERGPSKTYVRDLADGVRLEGHVSPCVFMYPGYPLQVQVALHHDGKSLGLAYAVNRTKAAQTYTDADVEALLAGVRIAPCQRCAAPAFDPATVETNRAGLCESCFMSDLEADIARDEEAESQEIAARDQRMKKTGMRFRVSAWIHPEGGGDDCFVDWYLNHHPTPEEVRGFLRERHSSVLDDYEIITL